MGSNSSSMSKNISYVLSVLIFLVFAAFVILRQRTPLNPSALEDYYGFIRSGFLNTVIVSFIALVGSVVLGFLLYLLQATKLVFFKAFIDVFTEIIYGTPLLVMIVVMAFVIGPSFRYFNRPVMGVFGLIIYITPYMTNIFKSAFSSIAEEQYMAMDLFGFTSFQRYRYIIIPQVIRILMPPLMNNFSLIIKGSALLNVLAYREVFYAISIAQNRTFAFVEGYLLMWVLYLMITIPLSQFTRFFERRWALE